MRLRNVDCGSSSSLEPSDVTNIRSVRQVNETPFLIQVHSKTDGSKFDGYQLSNRWLITSGSNIVHSNPDYYYLVVNSDLIEGNNGTNCSKNISIHRIIRHPLSGSSNWSENNLALIRMNESIPIESSICFPESEEVVQSFLSGKSEGNSIVSNLGQSSMAQNSSPFFYGIGRPWSWSPRLERALKIFPVNVTNHASSIIQVNVTFCEHLRSSDPLIVFSTDQNSLYGSKGKNSLYGSKGRNILLGFFKSIQGTCSVNEESMTLNFMRITSDHSRWIYDTMFEKRKVFPVRKKLVNQSINSSSCQCYSNLFLPVSLFIMSVLPYNL